MTIADFKKLFSRDLHKLHGEIAGYRNEAAIWKTEKAIANSAGNLCLHLVGNLNTYIGREIGGTGYVRNRDGEFSQKNIQRTELLERIQQTENVVRNSLNRLNEKALAEEYPLLVLEEKTTTGYFLLHLAIHLGYHLGQINYHRRLLDGE